MDHVQLRAGGTLFVYRVGGVAASRDRILLHRARGDDFWSVPGGRITIGETATEALVREMDEELGVRVEPGNVLWVIENFFRFRPLDGPPSTTAEMPHHEAGIYLQMNVPGRLHDTDRFEGIELAGTADEFVLEFRWFPTTAFPDLDVRPAVLRGLLSRPLPAGVPSIVNRDR